MGTQSVYLGFDGLVEVDAKSRHGPLTHERQSLVRDFISLSCERDDLSVGVIDKCRVSVPPTVPFQQILSACKRQEQQRD